MVAADAAAAVALVVVVAALRCDAEPAQKCGAVSKRIAYERDWAPIRTNVHRHQHSVPQGVPAAVSGQRHSCHGPQRDSTAGHPRRQCVIWRRRWRGEGGGALSECLFFSTPAKGALGPIIPVRDQP